MKLMPKPSLTVRICAFTAIAALVAVAGCAFSAEEASQMDAAPAPESAGYSGDAAMEAEAPSSAPAQRSAGMAMDEAMDPSAPVGVSAAEAANVGRKVIKTGDVDVEVENLDSAQKQIIEAVDRVNGFIQTMTVNDYETSRTAEIVARIPSEHFTQVYEAVKDLGKVERDHIGGQDVTQEYMDLERNIANLQAQEERVREMFNNAKTVEDLLKVEQRLTEVRGQIESLQGRLRYLKDQVGFSTLTITLNEYGEAPVEETSGWRIGYHLRGAIRTLIGSVQAVVHGLIRLVIGGALFWIALAVVIVLIRNWWINRRERREADKQQSEEQPPPPPAEE